MEDILKKDGLSFELLKELSFRSDLGIRLKKNLHYFDKEVLFRELLNVNRWYDTCELLGELIIDYRIKSIQFQLSSFHYPIEIQYNTYYDRQINNWLHKYVYKRGYETEVGCALRIAYENAEIKSENECREVLESVLSDSKKI